MKRKSIISIVAGLVAACFILLLFWLGGYNFDQRGDTAVMAAISPLFVFGMTSILVSTCPYID